jgi:hypothetical protein
MPIDVDGAVFSSENVRDSAFYQYTKTPLTKDGIMPFARYMVQEKGKLLLGNLSCAMCHTRVQPSGVVLKGAQAIFPATAPRPGPSATRPIFPSQRCRS